MDSGQHDVARTSFNEALSLARQVGDAALEVHALCNLALQSNFLGMPRQALRFAEAAERASKDAAPKVGVVLNLRKATAFALMGDDTSSKNAVTEARRRLDREAEKPALPWCEFVTSAEIDGIEGTRLLHLARGRNDRRIAHRAVRTLESAIARHGPKFVRNRALYRVRLASSQLELNSITDAARSATTALGELSNDVASSIVSTELDGVADALAPYRKMAEVELFVSRYDAAKDPKG